MERTQAVEIDNTRGFIRSSAVIIPPGQQALEHAGGSTNKKSGSSHIKPSITSKQSIAEANATLQYKCLYAKCLAKSSWNFKDRNRHMDSHFPDRFKCILCQRPLSRLDGCVRHIRRNHLRGQQNKKAKAFVEESPTIPYWRHDENRHLLVAPPEWDPLYDQLFANDVKDQAEQQEGGAQERKIS